MNSIYPEHTILDLSRQTKTNKISKILLFISEKSPQHNLKYKFRTFQKVSLNHSSNLPLHKTITSFKQLKTLKSVDIDLNWLFTSHQGIYILQESLKHNKNLSFLHFHPSKLPFKMDAASLRKTLKKRIATFRHMRIKLSFSASNHETEDLLTPLLKNLGKIRGLTSADLTFSDDYESLQIQKFLALLKKSKSLSNLSLNFRFCAFHEPKDWKNFFESLKEIKSLRNSNLFFDYCRYLSSPGLRLIASTVNEITEKSNIQIVFHHCVNTISRVDWWLFSWSIKKGNRSYQAETKFIGKNEKCSNLLKILIVFVCCLCVGVFLTPVIMGVAATKSSE